MLSHHILTLVLFSLATQALSSTFSCEQHNATANLESTKTGTNCLANFKDNPAIYDSCLNETCFLFIEEEPLISFDTSVFTQNATHLQRPFPCGTPKKLHPLLKGITFDIHRQTSSRDSLCIWAGDVTECEFNALVDFTEVMAAEGYKFGMTGSILETPSRQCHHNPSTSIVDGGMIIIGKAIETKSTIASAWTQLVQPFQSEAWAVFGMFFLIFVVLAIVIGYRFHFVRGRSLITAFLIFTGEFNEAATNAHTTHCPKGPPFTYPENKDDSSNSVESSSISSTSADNGQPYNQREAYNSSASFATKYGLVISLFRVGLIAFFAIFFLFYEVAIVNFLFLQKPVELSKPVTDLTTEELKQYSILRNTALERIWNGTVNRDGTKFDGTDEDDIPWGRCSTGAECLDWILDENNPVRFTVTYVAVQNFLLQDESKCENLTVFRTSDVLYFFNAGWLYNGQVEEEFRKQIDRELLEMRINGNLRRTIERTIGEPACKPDSKSDIGILIILIPCLLFVMPPLIGVMAVLIFWKKCWLFRGRTERGRRNMSEESYVDRRRFGFKRRRVACDCLGC